MKTKQLVGITSKSLLGGDPSGIDVVEEDGCFCAYLKSSDSESPVGTLKVEDGVIVQMDIDEDVDSGDVATAMIRSACKEADKKNMILIIHPESIVGGIKAVRFMEFFGFARGRDDYLERRPGSALPFSVMM